MQEPEWKGSSPQRFSGGRKHLRQQDEIGIHMLPDTHSPSQGIKTYPMKPTPEQIFKPALRIFPQSYSPTLQRKQPDLHQMKSVYFVDTSERPRREMRHYGIGETEKEWELKGLRTFEQSNRSRVNEYNIEAKMQTKKRVGSLDHQRNHLGVSSLGDKSYRYPEYAAGFCKEEGLVSGSTSFRKRQEEQYYERPKLSTIFTKPKWSEKQKIQQRQEQSRLLDSVDEWQRTILKSQNPRWNDPQTFFQRMEQSSPHSPELRKPPKK